MTVWFTTKESVPITIKVCLFDHRMWRDIPDTILCEEIYQVTYKEALGFSSGT
jgi:hypothetical protein